MNTGIIFDIKRYAIHDGPGIRTTVFLKGCPLQCRWCHNPEGIYHEPEVMYREERCGKGSSCIEACPEDAIIEKDGRKHILLDKCTVCGECADQCNAAALEIAGREITVDKLIAEIEKDTIFHDDSGGGVTFSGGEPLYQPEFLLEVLKQCRERDIHTTVDTSGYCD
ncbi:glycyl-radical enzyme activating protein, partial [candidate division KSB1 bacterium]